MNTSETILNKLAETNQELGLYDEYYPQWMIELGTWGKRGLELANFIAGWSKDPSTKVGCAIFDRKNRLSGVGFNGFPRNTPDSVELLNNKETKRLRMIHAEQNAIDHSQGSLEDTTFYITHSPCSHCAGRIIQHSPAKVIAASGPDGLSEDWKKSVEESILMFKDAEIPFLIQSPRNPNYAVSYETYKQIISTNKE